MKTITNPLSLVDKMEYIQHKMNLTNMNVFSLLAIHEKHQQLESWENPVWMEEQLDEYEESLGNN